MRIEFIPLRELDERSLGRWRELASTAAEPNPFFEPEYVLPHARGLGQTDEVAVMVLSEGDEWLGCMPFHRRSRWHRMPVRGIAGWRGHQMYGLLGTPLLSPDREEETAAALLAGIAEKTPRLGYSVLDWLTSDDDGSKEISQILLAKADRPVVFDRFQRAAVKRRPEPDYVEAALGSKRRRELRRQRRKLGELLGGEPEIVDRSDEASAYADFVELEARARKAETGTMIADDPGHVDFFCQMCTAFAELGRLQLLELRCAGRTVAAKCNLRGGDSLFMLKIAYDQEFASFSPGILLEIDMLKFFHEKTDAKLMDSCAAPGNQMINRLWPDRRTVTSYALPAPGIGGGPVRSGLTIARTVRDRMVERKQKGNDR
jgi:CelD/BcsL family acetyltransferase involved in cellulose biosynthesis